MWSPPPNSAVARHWKPDALPLYPYTQNKGSGSPSVPRPKPSTRARIEAPLAAPRGPQAEHVPHGIRSQLTRTVQRGEHRGVRGQPSAGVAAGTGACEMSHGAAHGTALFAAHSGDFCTSLPHPPHSCTPRQNPKPLQTGALQCYQSPSLCDSVPALSLSKWTLCLLQALSCVTAAPVPKGRNSKAQDGSPG